MHTHTHTRARAHEPTLKCQKMCCIKINPNAARAARHGPGVSQRGRKALAVSTALLGPSGAKEKATNPNAQSKSHSTASSAPSEVTCVLTACQLGEGLPPLPRPQTRSADGRRSLVLETSSLKKRKQFKMFRFRKYRPPSFNLWPSVVKAQSGH